jgi:hypothetical protein
MQPCQKRKRLARALTFIVLYGLMAGCGNKTGQSYSPPEMSDPGHPVNRTHPPAVRLILPANGAKYHAPADVRLLARATPHGTSLEPNEWTQRYADPDRWNFHQGAREISVEFFAGTNRLGSRPSGVVEANMRSLHGEAVPLIVTPVGYPEVELVWSNVPAGRYTLTANATNEEGLATVSSPVNVTVLP